MGNQVGHEDHVMRTLRSDRSHEREKEFETCVPSPRLLPILLIISIIRSEHVCYSEKEQKPCVLESLPVYPSIQMNGFNRITELECVCVCVEEEENTTYLQG